MKTTFCVAALAALLPLTANAGMFRASTPDEGKLKTRAADSIGVEPDEIALSDVEQDGTTTRFKAALADGTLYRCTVESPSGIAKFATWGQADTSDAMCSKRPGSGKGPEPHTNALLDAAKKMQKP
ncbi:hypothetical protein [Lysobacter sp. HA18]